MPLFGISGHDGQIETPSNELKINWFSSSFDQVGKVKSILVRERLSFFSQPNNMFYAEIILSIRRSSEDNVKKIPAGMNL